MVHALDDGDELRLREMGLRENIYQLPDGMELAARVTHSYPLGGKLPKAVACALASHVPDGGRVAIVGDPKDHSTTEVLARMKA